MKPAIKIVFNLFIVAFGSLSFTSLASAAGVATITYGPGATSVPTMGGTMLVAHPSCPGRARSCCLPAGLFTH